MAGASLMSDKEFPRGGIKHRKPTSNSSNYGPSVSAKKKGKKKHKKLGDKKKSIGKDVDTVTSIIELSNGIVESGMLLLGIVSSVTENKIELSLAGGLRAVVNVANISDTFTNRIMHQDGQIPFLSKLFAVGEIYPLKIISQTERSLYVFKATLEPKEVNGKVIARNICEGMVLTGEIKNKEEHGFVVNLGIRNANAFLKRDKIKNGIKYHVGQIIRCAVTQVIDNSISLSLLSEDVEKAVVQTQIPVDCFVPGMKFSLSVTNCLKTGLQVSMLGQNSDLQGSIYVNYLSKIFDNPLDYEIGSTLEGTLLYVLPLVNRSFFAISQPEQPRWNLSFGDIVKGKVFRIIKTGLYLKVGKKHEKEKCFVPLHKLRQGRKVLDGRAALKDIFEPGQIIPRVRIEHSSRFPRFYYGTTKKDALEAELFRTSDFKVGLTVKCTLLIIGDRYSTADLGRGMKGYVPLIHMTENGAKLLRDKFKEGQVVNARILSVRNNRVLLTLKPSLVKSQDPILEDDTAIEAGASYLGTIFEIVHNKLVVNFYGTMSGTVLRQHLPISRDSSIEANYHVGQVVKCYVISNNKTGLKLSLVNNADVDKLLTIGYEYPVVVESVAADGVYVEVKARGIETCPGFIPLPLLSRHSSLIMPLVDSIGQGDTLKAHCIHIDPLRCPPSLLTTHSIIGGFLKNLEKDVNPVVTGAVVPFFYLPGDGNVCELTPVIKHDPAVKFVIANSKYGSSRHGSKDFEVALGKVKFVGRKKVSISVDIKEVWDHHFMSSLKDLNDFLEEIDKLQKQLAERHPGLARFQLGKELEVVCERNVGKYCLLRVENTGLICRSWKMFPPGTKLRGRVAWVSYFENVAWIHTISDEPGAVTREKRGSIRARVVHVCPEVVVAEAVGSRELVFIPTKRHYNDHETYERAYNVGEITKLRVFRLTSRLLGIDRQIATKLEIGTKKKINSSEDCNSSDTMPLRKKRKIMDAQQNNDEVKWDADVESNHEPFKRKEEQRFDQFDNDSVSIEFVKAGSGKEPSSPVKQEVLSDDDTPHEAPISTDPDSDLEVKEECDEDVLTTDKTNPVELSSEESTDEIEQETPRVSWDVGFDWSMAADSNFLSKASTQGLNTTDSSSEEEINEDTTEKKKRKRLTGVERKQKAKETEERLRSSEEQRLDQTRPPQCPDDFDRLVMAHPNDSATWLQYMAHHLENTEIEKARSVARRALKTINYRQEQEKLNIWFAWLNLEQLYGTPDAQKTVFEEATRSNDSYKVYLHKLSVLANGGNSVEVEHLANVTLKKFKNEETVWWEVGALLMKVGKVETARNVLQRAMSLLPNKKHVNLIGRFAQLENEYGSSERAQTLYEHVLSAFPTRVDVWSTYADLMVTSNRIDLARHVLERATSQTLPPKKMKVLFNKFLAFEKTHGSPSDVERVSQAAGEYIDDDS